MGWDLDQLKRLMRLKRQDRLGRSSAQHPATLRKRDERRLYDAEVEEIKREIDTLSREMLGEDDYQEYLRSTQND